MEIYLYVLQLDVNVKRKLEFILWECRKANIVYLRKLEKGGADMPRTMQSLIERYVSEVQKVYGSHLRKIILYGSYARGDFKTDSDVDILILLDILELEIKEYRHLLSDMTYDFNMDYNLDIKPIAKSEKHFLKWVRNYPFYTNISREGVVLYAAA